jgi:hypothetical protein
MTSRASIAAIVVALCIAAPASAQEWYEPNPSLAELSVDDAYTREAAKSLETAGVFGDIIRLDHEGRLIVADGTRIARLAPDGRLDPTFGNAGVVELPVWGDILGLEIDRAGHVFVTGSFYDAGTYGPFNGDYDGHVYGAARLRADGSLDPDYSGDGFVELDQTTAVFALGEVHASGSDGGMVAVADKRNPAWDDLDRSLGFSSPIVGLVRIAADGTIDPTYGGGFAEIARPSPFLDTVRPVADFAVDSSGRAVVAGFDLPGSGGFGPRRGVLRFDSTGVLDRSFLAVTSVFPEDERLWPQIGAAHIALDGAGRLVGVDGQVLFRFLPDGAPDRSFSGDGFAWNQAVHVVGVTFEQITNTCSHEDGYWDPESFDSFCVGGLVAVAAQADRWALANPVVSYSKGRVAWRGFEVRAIDPADPGAIVSATHRFPGRSTGKVVSLVVSADGTAAYASGFTAVGGGSHPTYRPFLLRVDLASPTPLPLPDLRADWLGYVRAIDLGAGRYRVSALVRIRNLSRRDAESAMGLVDVGDGNLNVALAPYDGAPNSNPFRVRARSSVVKRFTWEGREPSTNLAAVRLRIQVSCELPDANLADNTAESRPITPLYAPR